ncbi:MAG TPA: hypothetical protein VKC16_05990, partial [Xanthobacteraceae bacterium]|nr:hypothetical protein [Xanthobacteraceae bacterium]
MPSRKQRASVSSFVARHGLWSGTQADAAIAVDKNEMRRQRLELYELPDYVPRKNKTNDYGFDPH